MFIKLFLILYADDTALMAESADKLQETLNCFEKYCDLWKLTVNINKTKVVIFSKKKCKPNYSFQFKGQDIEIIDSYCYLGMLFNYNGNFCTARKKITDQAHKALFAVYRKIRNISIPVDLQLKLFDCLVSPILLYASEVWGFENKDSIEKVHLQFCKTILKVRSTTPNYMVYGELGRYPMEIMIKRKIVLFWNNLLYEGNKLSSILYQLMFRLHQQNPSHFKWISYVKSIFDEIGLSFIWNDQLPIEKNVLKNIVSSKLNDQFIQKWFSQMNNSSRGLFYSEYKTEFGLEKYLLKLNLSDRIMIAKFRCSNIKFPIETGRWNGVPKDERICNLCGNGIGDEVHYLFICQNQDIKSIREKVIPKYYIRYPSQKKLSYMMMYCHVELYRNMSTFLRKIVKFL